MSDNKFRYYTVTETTVVKACNSTDARAIARGRRGVAGQVVDQTSGVERISAVEAKSIAASS